MAMKNRFRLVKYGTCGGMYYWHDTATGQRASPGTKDKSKAAELLVAKNESVRDPSFNLQKSRIYDMVADPKSGSRTWGTSIDALIASKPKSSENRARLERFSREKSLHPILDVILLETRAEQLLNVLCDGGVSTNTFLRRVQNFCVGMNWLPCPILPRKL